MRALGDAIVPFPSQSHTRAARSLPVYDYTPPQSDTMSTTTTDHSLDLSHPALHLRVEPFTIELLHLAVETGQSSSDFQRVVGEMVVGGTPGKSFFSYTRTEEEISILASEERSRRIASALEDRDGRSLLASETTRWWVARRRRGRGPLPQQQVARVMSFSSS